MEGRFTSDRADSLRKELTSADERVVIDATDVNCIGALCAEELYKARSIRHNMNGTWSLSASAEMRSDLELLGLSVLIESVGDKNG